LRPSRWLRAGLWEVLFVACGGCNLHEQLIRMLARSKRFAGVFGGTRAGRIVLGDGSCWIDFIRR